MSLLYGKKGERREGGKTYVGGGENELVEDDPLRLSLEPTSLMQLHDLSFKSSSASHSGVSNIITKRT